MSDATSRFTSTSHQNVGLTICFVAGPSRHGISTPALGNRSLLKTACPGMNRGDRGCRKSWGRAIIDHLDIPQTTRKPRGRAIPIDGPDQTDDRVEFAVRIYCSEFRSSQCSHARNWPGLSLAKFECFVAAGENVTTSNQFEWQHRMFQG